PCWTVMGIFLRSTARGNVDAFFFAPAAPLVLGIDFPPRATPHRIPRRQQEVNDGAARSGDHPPGRFRFILSALPSSLVLSLHFFAPPPPRQHTPPNQPPPPPNTHPPPRETPTPADTQSLDRDLAELQKAHQEIKEALDAVLAKAEAVSTRDLMHWPEWKSLD